MVYFVHAKKLEWGETSDNEMEQDDLQVTDTSVKIEKDKNKQPTAEKNTIVITNDLEIGQLNVIINLLLQDEMDGEP